MDRGSQRLSVGAATLLVAAIACLQPGIDPVFLTLLSAAHGVAPADHGWVVGATQTGMAAGSLILWRLGAGSHRAVILFAALGTLAASMATVAMTGIYALIAARALFGFGMGIIYTQAMSRAAADRPAGAYGAVFLIQLILSTIVALLLPAVAEAASAASALGVLALGPLLVLALLIAPAAARGGQAAQMAAEPSRAGNLRDVPVAGWAFAAATICFICATMMIWSFAGALATAAGIDEASIGLAVAIGSVAGALTAIVVMRERPVVPLPVTGVLASLCLIAPLVLTGRGRAEAFILAIILLNIGSTSIIVRCSGMASARGRGPLFRQIVASTHPLGMIAGPVIGSLLMMAFGQAGLIAGAVVSLMAGSLLLLIAAFDERLPLLRQALSESEGGHDPVTT